MGILVDITIRLPAFLRIMVAVIFVVIYLQAILFIYNTLLIIVFYWGILFSNITVTLVKAL